MQSLIEPHILKTHFTMFLEIIKKGEDSSFSLKQLKGSLLTIFSTKNISFLDYIKEKALSSINNRADLISVSLHIENFHYLGFILSSEDPSLLLEFEELIRKTKDVSVRT